MARMLAKKAIPRTKFCFRPTHPCAVRVAMMSRLNKTITPGCRKRSGYARRARARGAASDEKVMARLRGHARVRDIMRTASGTYYKPLFLHDVLETTDSLVHEIINNPSMATACCRCYRELAVVVFLRCVRDAPDADASRTRQPLVTAVCYQRNQVEPVASYASVPPAHCTRDPPTPTLVWAAKAWPSPFQNTLIKTPTTWAMLSMTSSMRNITAVNWRYLCRPTQNSPRGRGRDPRTNEDTKKINPRAQGIWVRASEQSSLQFLALGQQGNSSAQHLPCACQERYLPSNPWHILS